ncbi:MAG TPA: hypothetical protein PKW42_03855, partial [bacterium]|nr:hypothetical protein [bacterium]
MRPQKQIGLGFAVLAVSLLFGQLCFSGHFSIVGTSPTSCDFYGTVQVNGSPAQPGDEVAAFDPQGVCCGVFTVNTEGFYGFMAVYGDDSTTPTIDEGAQPGDTITFKIWQASTNQVFDAVLLGPDSPVWVDKGKLNVNLSTSVSQLTLSVTSTYGSPNPGVGIHYYNTGTQVTASVTSPVDAGSGVRYVCTGWTGTGDVPASGTATSVTFTITQNSTITWNWKVQYLLTTQTNPAAGGSVTPSSNWYDSGESVQVTAVANSGFTFTGWSGDLTGTDNPATVTMNSGKTVMANFSLTGRRYTPVAKTPSVREFYGVITINGVPAQSGDEVGAFDPQGVCCGAFVVEHAGYYGYLPVYGDDSTTPAEDEGAENGDTITFRIWDASEQKEYLAIASVTPLWDPSADPLEVNLSTGASLTVSSAYGSPEPSVGLHIYDTLTQVTASVVSPVAGETGIRYVCTGWTGTGDVPTSGTATSVTFTITNNSTITWNWKVQYYLTTQADPVQAGTVTPASNWYDSGSQVQVQATANPSYVFDHWSGDLSGSTNPTVVTVNAPRTVTAVFLGQVNLTVASAYGSPDPGVGSHSYATGTSVTASVFSPVTAGNTRYVCTGWTGTGDVPASGTATSVTFTITQNSTITWNWKVQYLLTTQTNPAAGGSVTPSSNWYDSGESVQVTAVANSGFTFTGWSGDLTGTDNPATVTMNSGKTVMANFSLTGRRYTPVAKTPSVREFYGVITINGVPAQSGDEVGAFDPQGVCCGAFVVEHAGYYGYLPVYGDDSTTPAEDEGAENGDTITFRIWDASEQKEYLAIASVTPLWDPSADPLEVNLSTGASLTVSSAYGSPEPSVGLHIYDTLTQVTASVVSPVAGETGIRYVCTGWTGTGDVPTSGTATSVTFTITNNSTITWNWKTQYLLTIVSAYGTPVGAGWYDAGTTANWSVTSPVAGAEGVRYVAVPSSGSVLMDGPKTITISWITQYYLTLNSTYGTPVGAGWYNEGTSANWSVNSPVAGATGVQYVAIPASGSVFM